MKFIQLLHRATPPPGLGRAVRAHPHPGAGHPRLAARRAVGHPGHPGVDPPGLPAAVQGRAPVVGRPGPLPGLPIRLPLPDRQYVGQWGVAVMVGVPVGNPRPALSIGWQSLRHRWKALANRPDNVK